MIFAQFFELCRASLSNELFYECFLESLECPGPQASAVSGWTFLHVSLFRFFGFAGAQGNVVALRCDLFCSLATSKTDL